MKDENTQNVWRENLWRRKLTEAERAELRARPEMAAEVEVESRLSELLTKIPDMAVPSNFTARILQAVDLEESRRSRPRTWNWHALLPRIAVAGLVVLVAGVAIQHYELTNQRARVARNVALVAGAPLPSVDALKNFDVIQRMSQPRADEELLALMQ